MIRRALLRHSYAATIATLAVAICAVAAYLIVVAIPDLTRATADASPGVEPTVAPAPTARSAMALSPIGIEMPPGSDCGGCHLTATGAVGTKPIPALAHPLWGWRDCTACHATDRLVATAPGHSGLHKADCLVCHKTLDTTATATAAPPRPHHVVTGETCLSCHGSQAPLPTDMAGRTNCWVCHTGTDTSALFGNPAGPTPAP